MLQSPSFREVVRNRHSVRKFLPDPVPQTVIQSVLQDAQLAPSNCNTQPWQVHIVSGSKREQLTQAMLADVESGAVAPDFAFDVDSYNESCVRRAKSQGAAYYQAIGVPREAADMRTNIRHNLELFGAPHVALLFMPDVADNVRVAGDLGMYGQTFLLSLTAHGLGGIPQTSLGFHAVTIRRLLRIDPAWKMLFGISFGYPDKNSAANVYRIDKIPVEESVTFHT